MKCRSRKALKRELNRQILDFDKKYIISVNALVMWTLHEEFGFGRKRIRRFWERVVTLNRELRNRYRFDQAGEEDWLYKKLLLDIGVDVEGWWLENSEKEGEES